jgi:hypothetical protein
LKIWGIIYSVPNLNSIFSKRSFEMKNKFVNALTIALILFHAVAPIGALAWVGTDQADYAPGSVVTISGDNSDSAGYLAGESVHVDVWGPNGYTAACDGDADANGAWSCQVTLWDTYLAWGSYSYTATGQLSGVSQSGEFTDAVNTGSFASNCTTPQDSFTSGSTVCIKVTGLGNGASGTIKWWAPGLNPATDSPTRYTTYGPVNGNVADSYLVTACGTWNVLVTASAVTGGASDFDDTFDVTSCAPVNSAPNAGTISGDSPVEGSSHSYSSNASDPDSDTLIYTWSVSSGNASIASGQGTNSVTLDFGDGPSAVVLHLVVDDGHGHSVSPTDKSISVLNVAPTATFGSPDVSEGNDINLSLTAPMDVAADMGTLQYAFDCDDGAGYGAFGVSNSATCLTNDNDTRTVKGKIKDKDGGETEYTNTVTISNVAPTATFNASTPVNEGSAISLSLTAPFDPSSADAAAGFQYAFDCGSGYGLFGTSDSTTCPTDDNGSRTVKGKIQDKDGGVNEYTASVSINNVAPIATFNAPTSVNEGSNINLSLTDPFDPSSADTTAGFQYAFDCDDGSGFGSLSGASTASCPTTDNGSRTVQSKIQDKDGGFSTYSGSVTINNVAPTATFAASSPSNEGDSNTLSFINASDPSSADTAAGFHYSFACDGQTSSLAASYATAGTSASAPCPFDDNGSYTVKGRIFDKDNGYTDYSATVVVNNGAPTATFGATSPINEGSSSTLSFTSPSDPSNADTAAGFQYSFACDGLAASLATTYAGAGTSDTADCPFADNGSYTVMGRIFDKDNGYTDYSATVVVNNVAPTIDGLVASAAASCGGINSLTINFTDPAGANDTYSASIDWGDGSPAEPFNDISSGDSFGHVYSAAGIYTVSVTVFDEDGGTSTSVSTTLTLNFAIVGGGVLPPINQNGTSVFKYKSTIPVKIKVQDCDGSFPGNLTIKIKLTQLSGSAPNTDINEPFSTSAADTTGYMRFTGSPDYQYIYNLATKPLPDATATYKITLTIVETGQTVTVNFGLKP